MTPLRNAPQPHAPGTGDGPRVADVMVTCPKTHGPDCGLEEIRALFDDDHVQMALIVTGDGRLITTIERPDLAATASNLASASEAGTLASRTVSPSHSVAAALARLLREGRRRLAVVDDSGQLLGLVCLKRDLTGFCSDEGVRARASERLRLPRQHQDQHRPGRSSRPDWPASAGWD